MPESGPFATRTLRVRPDPALKSPGEAPRPRPGGRAGAPDLVDASPSDGRLGNASTKSCSAIQEEAATGKKIIAVVGATGAQGSGLMRAILADPHDGFAARALTRNATSDKARDLPAQGSEVLEVDISDELGLTRAFEGAYGAYLVTNFWSTHPHTRRRRTQPPWHARPRTPGSVT